MFSNNYEPTIVDLTVMEELKKDVAITLVLLE
jgi:hypothetical protein